MKTLVRGKSPAELEKISAAKLKEMGVPESLAEVFLKNVVQNRGPYRKESLWKVEDRVGERLLAKFVEPRGQHAWHV
jgi:hypothetical protein